MKLINTNKDFAATLNTLSLTEQRYLGAEFITSILDIIDEPRLKSLIVAIKKDGNSAEELHDANRLAHSIYIETHPQSDLCEIDFKRQAVHTVAEACITCLAPVYQETTALHLATKVATYCRMAITCLTMPHDQDSPDFSKAENEMKKVIQKQYEILNRYLESER